MAHGLLLFNDLTPSGKLTEHLATQLPRGLADAIRRMTTMASEHGSSSSSELDEDEILVKYADEIETILSSNSSDVPDDTDPDLGDSTRSSTSQEEPRATVTMTARAYQLEMLEESLKKNVIVAVCQTPRRYTKGLEQSR